MSVKKTIFIISSPTLIKDDTYVLWSFPGTTNVIDAINLFIKEKTHPLRTNAFVVNEFKDPKVDISELDIPRVPGSPGIWVKMPLDRLLAAIAVGKPNASIQINCQCIELIKKIDEVYKQPIIDEFNHLVESTLCIDVSQCILLDNITTSVIFREEIIPQIFADVSKLPTRKLQINMYAKQLLMIRLSRYLGFDSI